jgi:predicted TIM-barrel fold metal-dependent hydrolase
VISRGKDDGPVAVVDIHAHIGPAERPGEDDGRLKAMLRAMDEAGVDRACVFASAGRGSDYATETDLIIELSHETAGRIVPFARVHPFWGEDAVADLRRAADAGVRGLKLHPFMDGAFLANDRRLVHPLVRVAADRGLVVLVHSGWGFNSAPGLVADLARAFPSVPVIMGHSGRYGYHREAAAVGAELPNLHYDVAGLATPSAVDEIVSLAGPARVLFGTDHPYSPMGFELEKVARWTTMAWEQTTQVVGSNASRLLNLEADVAGPLVQLSSEEAAFRPERGMS